MFTDEETDAMKMCLGMKIYWIMHSVATVGAFAITAIYWGFVFDPGIFQVLMLVYRQIHIVCTKL